MSASITKNFKFKYDPESLMNALARHLYSLKKESVIFPFRLFIYPSGLCNDSCRYCNDGARAGRKSSEDFLQYKPVRDFFANKEYIDKLIKDIKDLEIRDIHLFGGGEPFFYKASMFYFLEKLKDTDVFIRIITNANNLDTWDVDYMVKNKLVSSLNISFNTDSKEAAMMIYSDFSRHSHSLNILEAIVKCKENYKTDFPRVNVMATLLNTNYNKVPDIIQLIGGYRVDFFSLQPLRYSADNQKQFKLTKEQEDAFVQTIPQIESRLNEFEIFSNISEFKKEEKNVSDNLISNEPFLRPKLKNKNNLTLECYLPLVTLAISYDGSIPVCFFKYDKQYKSNYFELKSLNKFLHSREYKEFIYGLINSKLPDICGDCKFCSFQELQMIKERFISFKD